MDGLLIVDKPVGLTSHDVVSRVRRVVGTKRVGHTGTLDPFATGVMVILVGQATRLAQFLDKDVKEYVADIQFGWETDTGDVTGTRKEESGMSDEEVAERLASADREKVLSRFRGEIMQVPPMYSAKKIDGKKLYELARAGKEIERKPVKVSITNLQILSDESRISRSAFRISVTCSAGTYIRTLAEDIGRAIGVGAHLTGLRRTAAGKFDISQSRSLEKLEEIEDPSSVLLPLNEAVTHLTRYEVSDDRIDKTRSGLSTRVAGLELDDGEFVRMAARDNSLIAVGVYEAAEKSIRPKVVLN